MFELKPITKASIPRALERAEHYRLLNEPLEAESICRDVLRADSENQQAVVTLLLALTDQFGRGASVSVRHAEELLDRLPDGYERIYYEGVIHERWAKLQLHEGNPGSMAYDWFVSAMNAFEQAEAIAPKGVADARLRWNTCARIIKRNNLKPRPEDIPVDAGFSDDAPI